MGYVSRNLSLSFIFFAGIGAVSVLNHYFNRDDIILGAYKGDYGKDFNGNWVRGHYVDDLVNNWDSPVWNSDQVCRHNSCHKINQESDFKCTF